MVQNVEVRFMKGTERVREASSLSVLCIVGRALKTEKQKMSFGF